MIEKILNHPHLLHQRGDNDDAPNATIAASLDNGNSLVLSQEGRYIVIDRSSVPELCKLLRLMASLRVK